MYTKSWGPHTWISEHYISFNYPTNPTKEEKEYYKNHYLNLGNMLPCSLCKNSYNKLIKDSQFKITDDVLADKNTLSYWFYKIHEAVNKKLDVQYFVTYEEVKKRYSCDIDYSETSESFTYRDSQIISPDIVDIYMPYIKSKVKDNKLFDFYILLKKKLPHFIKNKNDEVWVKRNKLCRKYIDLINYNNETHNSSSIESQLCINELKLMLLCSSTLGRKKLMLLQPSVIPDKCNVVLLK